MNVNLQKSLGTIDVEFINNDVEKLYQQGCLKALLPQSYSSLSQLVLVNTSGGVTSGDKFSTNINLHNTHMLTTSQAAEKVYSGYGDAAELKYTINIDNSNLFWIPNETILFDNCNLRRQIDINLLNNSNLFFCETVVYGRSAMNETIEKGYYSDRWKIFNDNKIAHHEINGFEDNIKRMRENKFMLNDNIAVNTIIILGSEMNKFYTVLKDNIHDEKSVTTGISEWDGKIVIRSISSNNYYLKKLTKTIVSIMMNDKIPYMWGAA